MKNNWFESKNQNQDKLVLLSFLGSAISYTTDVISWVDNQFYSSLQSIRVSSPGGATEQEVLRNYKRRARGSFAASFLQSSIDEISKCWLISKHLKRNCSHKQTSCSTCFLESIKICAENTKWNNFVTANHPIR